MKRPMARVAFGAALLASAAAGGRPVASPAGNPGPTRSAYLLGLGGDHSRGNSINNHGWIAGYSHLDASYRHATLWPDDTPTDLGALGDKNRPKNSNVAWPVKNTRGLIVGISQTDSPDPWGENWSCSAFFPPATSTGYRCLGFAWEKGAMRALPTLGGTHGYAAAANNLGQIVGWAENTVRDSSCTPPQIFQFRAVVWGPRGKHIQELPILPQDSSSAATAINDKGQIVGISGDCDEAIGSATAAHAVLWDGGTVTELPNFGGAEWNTPTAINERGEVAGFSDHAGDIVTEAFLWTPEGGLQALGFLYDDHVLSEAFGMNKNRQVVGLSCSASECRAFLWQDGVMHDLNLLIAPDDSMLLTHAMDINDDGVITGRAFRKANGERVTYAATPTGSAITVGSTIASEARRRAAVLPAEAVQEILHPLGPGREQLSVRASR
jgi:probable HAF family extracellular repeat protein